MNDADYRLPCGCYGSRSVLHLTLHHPLAYAIGAVIGLVIAFVQNGAPLFGALVGWIGIWILARLIR